MTSTTRADIEAARTDERGALATYAFRAQQISRRLEIGLDLMAYLTVVVSVAMTLMTASDPRPATVVLFLGANGAWVLLFWLLWRGKDPARDRWLVVAAFLTIGLGTQGLFWLGLGLDWLLPMLTVSILAFYLLNVRQAAMLALFGVLGMACVMMTVPGPASSTALTDRIQSIISLLPAYLFSFLFSVFLRQQFEQRARAEGLVRQLEEAQEQLRAHAESVEELAIARERNRMAREIHDTLGHYLTVLAVQLETAIKLEERDDSRLREELSEARRVAAECLVEVRRSVRALRPVDPTESSFIGALEQLRAEFEATAPAVEVTLDVEGPVQALAPELRMALYRCAQEAMTNVRKHAQATKVLVRMRMDACQVELTVLDNGRAAREVSCEGLVREPGFGLLGMRERMALLGGRVHAKAEPGRGWRVEVVVPIAAPLIESVGAYTGAFLESAATLSSENPTASAERSVAPISARKDDQHE